MPHAPGIGKKPSGTLPPMRNVRERRATARAGWLYRQQVALDVDKTEAVVAGGVDALASPLPKRPGTHRRRPHSDTIYAVVAAPARMTRKAASSLTSSPSAASSASATSSAVAPASGHSTR